MTHQTPIKSYFKVKNNISSEISNRMLFTPTKRNLGCSNTTPKKLLKLDKSFGAIKVRNEKELLKSPQQNVEDNPTNSFIEINDSAPRQIRTPTKTSTEEKELLISSPLSECNLSTCSDKTEVYFVSPQTPKTSASRNTFYSPTKKRSVKRLSLKKKLTYANDSSSPLKKTEFKDDKTLFFMDMVTKFLSNKSLYSLIEEDSVGLLKKCLELTEPGVRLISRLYWRKQGWYRYEETKKIINGKNTSVDDPEVKVIINQLVDYGLISLLGSNSRSFDDLIPVLRAQEIKSICKDLKINIPSFSKQQAVDALRSFSQKKPISAYFTGSKSKSNSTRVLDMLHEKAGPAYKLPEIVRGIIYRVYMIMFLGIDHRILSEKRLELILINDKTNTETYPIPKNIELDNASIVFESKIEFDKYMTASYLYDEFETVTCLENKCKIIEQAFHLYKQINDTESMRYASLPPWLRRFTSAHLYVKILSAGVQDLKRNSSEASYSLAIDILNKLIDQTSFRQHRKADWYAEKAHILHTHYEEFDLAGEVLLECFKSDLPDELKDMIRPRAIKIATQKNKKVNEKLTRELLEHATDESLMEKNFKADHIQKAPIENSNKGKSKFITRTEDGLLEQSCEEYCISWYMQNGNFTQGRHWEGRILSSIFFLLFWDIIYSTPRGIKGIFLSYYQTYPLDMLTECFYHNRKALIDDWLTKIQQMSVDELIRIIESKWKERPEREISMLNRGAMSLEETRSATRCLGPRAVSALCRRLAVSYSHARAGFPDLTLWNHINHKIKFVEVKTDADKPSMKQMQWMRYLEKHGIDTSFGYVGVNTTRNRARAKESMNSCE